MNQYHLKTFRLIRILGGALLTTVGAFYFVSVCIREINQIEWGQTNLLSGPLIIACVLNVVCFLCLIRVFHVLLKVSHTGLSYQVAAGVFFLSNIGKYIPGKVFMAFSRITELNRFGVKPVEATVMLAAELLFFVLGALFLSIGIIPFRGRISFVWVCGIIVLVIVLIVFGPVLFRKLLTCCFRSRKEKSLPIDIKPRTIIAAFAWSICAWASYGVSGWLFARSVGELSIANLPVFIAVLSLSWAAGLVAVVAPGGIGVREAGVVVGLSIVIPQSTAVLVAVLLRLAWFAIEAIGWILSIATKSQWADSYRYGFEKNRKEDQRTDVLRPLKKHGNQCQSRDEAASNSTPV